jgi:hypothetical protein
MSSFAIQVVGNLPRKIRRMSDYSEDALIEQAAIALFSQLGYETLSCFYEICGPNNPSAVALRLR